MSRGTATGAEVSPFPAPAATTSSPTSRSKRPRAEAGASRLVTVTLQRAALNTIPSRKLPIDGLPEAFCTAAKPNRVTVWPAGTTYRPNTCCQSVFPVETFRLSVGGPSAGPMLIAIVSTPLRPRWLTT